LRYPDDHWARRAPTDEHLADYLGRAGTYNLTKVRVFERLLGADLRGIQILDYGGGAGFMAVRCAELGARVTLADAEPNALATARLLAAKRGVDNRVATICSEAFPRELQARRFDVVILKDVLEHIPDDGALLRSLAGCQDAGGRLLLCTHSTWSLNFLLEGSYKRWWCGEKHWLGWDMTHLRFYTPRSLRRLLRGAGYVTRRWCGLYILPYQLLSSFRLDVLHKIDLWFGHLFPLNRLGWNVVIEAVRSPGSGRVGPPARRSPRT
jgi:2-polyprenyl-6-hydroxyphenyl methylase/3-demethylubiquinone-9 3-methyltransferase